MEPFPNVIKRVFMPSHLDEAPYGTLCEVEGDECYVQISKTKQPNWYQVSSKEDGILLVQELLRNSI